jgi:glycosyltransferase involved in cell wall biosynthesis
VPFLSIITPLHNKEDYIAETIESVLSQSFQDWELIAVENWSKDRGPDIVQNFVQKDIRIRLIEAPPNVRGPGAARNLGIQESRGEWIQFLDADDLLLPGHFEAQLLAIQSNPQADIVTCDWLEGPELGESCERKRPTNAFASNSCAEAAIAFTPWVVHSAWMRKAVLGDGPWWDESFDREAAEDHVFWFRVLQGAELAYSPHAGVYYRTETAARRHDNSHIARYLKIVDRAIQTNIDFLQSSGRELTYRHNKVLMNSYLEQCLADCGDSELEKQILRRIAEFRPSVLEAIRRRDAATIASHFLPPKVLARIQKRRRGASSSSRS